MPALTRKYRIDYSEVNLCPGSVFINYSQECNDFCLILQSFLYSAAYERKITSDWLNLFGLANEKLCYFQIHKIVEKRSKNVLNNGRSLYTCLTESSYYNFAKRMFLGIYWNQPFCPYVRLCTKY